MPTKSRFAEYFQAYAQAAKSQKERRAAADQEVGAYNWAKGAAIDGAVRSDAGDRAIPRILEVFHEEFGDDATVQHARMCLNAFRAFPTVESRVGRGWTACAAIVAPVRRLLQKEGDENPTPEAVASRARTDFLENRGLATVTELKAAVKQNLGGPTVTRKARVTITKARKTVREFLRTAKPREADAFRVFLVETLEAMEAPPVGPTAKPTDVTPTALVGSGASIAASHDV